MLNTKILVLVFVVSLSLLGLVKVKVYVQDLREEIVEAEKIKSKLNDEVQVLRAEWSNLNRPERLRRLSDEYLNIGNANSKTIKHLRGGSRNLPLGIMPAKTYESEFEVSWRYKLREVVMNSGKER